MVKYVSGVVILAMIFKERKKELEKYLKKKKAMIDMEEKQKKLKQKRKRGEKAKKGKNNKNSKKNEKRSKIENSKKSNSNNKAKNNSNDFSDIIDNIKEDGDDVNQHKKLNNPVEGNFFNFQIQNSNDDNNNNANDSNGAFFCDFSEIMELSDTNDKNNNNSNNVISKGEDDSNPEKINEVNFQARDKEERQGSKSLEKNKFNSNDDIHMNPNDECDNKMMIDFIDDDKEEKIVSEMKLKMKKIRDINSKYDEEIMRYVDSIIPKV